MFANKLAVETQIQFGNKSYLVKEDKMGCDLSKIKNILSGTQPRQSAVVRDSSDRDAASILGTEVLVELVPVQDLNGNGLSGAEVLHHDATLLDSSTTGYHENHPSLVAHEVNRQEQKSCSTHPKDILADISSADDAGDEKTSRPHKLGAYAPDPNFIIPPMKPIPPMEPIPPMPQHTKFLVPVSRYKKKTVQ